MRFAWNSQDRSRHRCTKKKKEAGFEMLLLRGKGEQREKKTRDTAGERAKENVVVVLF